MLPFLQATVRKEVTYGVLAGGLILALIIWFLAYTQSKADAFTEFTTGSYLIND